MIEYILISGGVLTTMTLSATDAAVIPDESSMIVAAPEWATMCKEAGGEASLIAALGVTDMRGETWAL